MVCRNGWMGEFKRLITSVERIRNEEGQEIDGETGEGSALERVEKRETAAPVSFCGHTIRFM